MTSVEVIARASTKDFEWSPAFRTFFGHVSLFGSKMSVFGSPDVIELKSEKTGDVIAFVAKHVDQDYVQYDDTKGLGINIELNLIPGQALKSYKT